LFVIIIKEQTACQEDKNKVFMMASLMNKGFKKYLILWRKRME